MDIQVINKGSDISRLLGMKGLTRLAIEDELTSAILGAKFFHYSGLNLRFLEEVIEFDVDSIGIQETDCGSCDYYYILIYILK